MCSIILRLSETGAFIGANRDEMLARAWAPPAHHWPEHPGIIAGQDLTAGGTWLGMNAHGLVAAVLNRTGTLGPAAGKHSRGELPLLALEADSLEEAAEKIRPLDAAAYRSFNLVLASSAGAIFFRGLESGAPREQALGPGTWMITSGDANDRSMPRIARHLPKFTAAAPEAWPALLADNTQPESSALNIPPHDGFATVSSAVINLPRSAPPSWRFAAGAPHIEPFLPISLAKLS